MVLEQAGEPLAGAEAVAGENDFVAAFAQLGDMVCDRFVDIGLLRPLGREIARRLDAEIDGAVGFGLGEGGGEVDRPRRRPLRPTRLSTDKARQA